MENNLTTLQDCNPEISEGKNLLVDTWNWVLVTFSEILETILHISGERESIGEEVGEDEKILDHETGVAIIFSQIMTYRLDIKEESAKERFRAIDLDQREGLLDIGWEAESIRPTLGIRWHLRDSKLRS